MNNEIPAGRSMELYMHCGKCLEERPSDISPQDWASLEAGWTLVGLQIWCKRHDCNVVHIDFEGHKHPANTTRLADKPKLVVV